MAYNPSPKVRSAEKVAKQHGYDKVIVVGIKESEGTFDVTSYGISKKECDKAKKFIDPVHDAVYNKWEEMI